MVAPLRHVMGPSRPTNDGVVTEWWGLGGSLRDGSDGVEGC